MSTLERLPDSCHADYLHASKGPGASAGGSQTENTAQVPLRRSVSLPWHYGTLFEFDSAVAVDLRCKIALKLIRNIQRLARFLDR